MGQLEVMAELKGVDLSVLLRRYLRRGLEADLAGWSSRGRLEVVPNSNHAFFFTRPQVVVDAVNEVLAAARVARRPTQQPGLRFRGSPYWAPPVP